MLKQTFLAHRATRWWSAPVRFTANAAALLRAAGGRVTAHRSWLTQTPVGIRAALTGQAFDAP